MGMALWKIWTVSIITQNINCVAYFWNCYIFIWATSWENLSSGFATRWNSIQPAQLQRLASLEISALASRGITLSRQRTTKVLIRLRRCAGWSASLLFAYCINRFSHEVAHIYPEHLYHKDPKFSDRQFCLGKPSRPRSVCAWRISLISVCIVCHSASIFWTRFCAVKPYCSNFRISTALFFRRRIFFIFR